jgi:hypothetical protein
MKNEELRILFLIPLLLFFSCVCFSLSLEFDRTTPLYLKNFIEKHVNIVSEDLEQLWGTELEFPIEIKLEKQRGLGASGEAAFDGEQFYLFLTPVASAIPDLLKHEMMHIYTFQWFYSNDFQSAPLWFIEGLAVWYESHSIESIKDLNPISLMKEINVLEVEAYPVGDAFSRYYQFLADFFYEIDAEYDIRKSFNEMLKRLKKTHDFYLLFDEDSDVFFSLYEVWKRKRILISLGGFVFLQLSWLLPAVAVVFLGIIYLIRSRRFKDVNIKELERLYGEKYWRKSDDD